ncbi:MAG TPA: cytochrome b/b6 domain-containing protein [Mucilaginibacter sp.]|jgi:Ni/Fe-hydrogenase 1 B-type cytochrome subunit|nr:cytochrome b/b6 domain-containing protein [Mucilaginibacter sp.]
MALIEPVKKGLTDSTPLKKYSAPLRLWHWLSAIVISGSLLTVLADSTITNGRTNAGIIQKSLSEKSISVSPDQARGAAHEISDKVWELHTYFGYTLAALFVFRLILELFQRADQKLIRNIKAAYEQHVVLKKNRETAKHELVVKSLYFTFYTLLLIMAVTGMCLAFEDDIEALKKIHAIREIHGFCMYLILAFIVVHLAGVFLAERRGSKGIVSDMINGGSTGE